MQRLCQSTELGWGQNRSLMQIGLAVSCLTLHQSTLISPGSWA
jgi:hypothetical protein